MSAPGAILVIQTAFIGDVVLVLPLLQRLREELPASRLGIMSVPSSAGVLQNHPAVNAIHLYDKRGADRGLAGLRRIVRELRGERYDLALIPHRSMRSAAIAWSAKIPRRIGFDTSAGRMLLTERVRYHETTHEIARNLALVSPLGITRSDPELPRLYPSRDDWGRVAAFLAANATADFDHERMIGLAPGSIWFTKRWPKEQFEGLAGLLLQDGYSVVLVGGNQDRPLCQSIVDRFPENRVISAAGKLSLLQSAALLGRCRVVVSNDSAPMHLATGIGTPVIGIFGATVPSFGFAPTGSHDRTAGIDDLSCRPCAIHGGRRCPIGTLECMWGITPSRIHLMIQEILHGTPRDGGPAPT